MSKMNHFPRPLIFLILPFYGPKYVGSSPTKALFFGGA